MAKPTMALPKLLVCLKTYERKDLLSDLIAGITVGLVRYPLRWRLRSLRA